MFLPPKQVFPDYSGGSFASNRVNGVVATAQVINPKTVISSIPGKLSPIEEDSFLGSMLGGLNSVVANPITTTDGRKKLSTVDPYKDVINTPQNQLASVLSNYFGTPGVVLGGIIKNEPLRKMTSELIRTGKVDSDTSKAFLKGFSNNLLAGVTDMSAPFLKEVQAQIGLDGVDSKQLLSSAMGLPGAPRIENVLTQNPTINMIIKGKEYLSNADFSSTAGIFKVVENLTANKTLTSLFDLKTELALMNAVTNALMAFDAPDLFSDIGKWFRDEDNEVAGGEYDRETAYYLDNLENAIDNSSMTYLEGLLERVPASKVLDENRNFIEDFLGKFKLRFDQEPSEEIGLRLNKLMTDIDANWNKTQLIPGVGDYVSDLKPFKLMSDDAHRVLTLTGLYDVELAMSGYYPIKPVKDYMKALYPLALL